MGVPLGPPILRVGTGLESARPVMQGHRRVHPSLGRSSVRTAF